MRGKDKERGFSSYRRYVLVLGAAHGFYLNFSPSTFYLLGRKMYVLQISAEFPDRFGSTYVPLTAVKLVCLLLPPRRALLLTDTCRRRSATGGSPQLHSSSKPRRYSTSGFLNDASASSASKGRSDPASCGVAEAITPQHPATTLALGVLQEFGVRPSHRPRAYRAILKF
jgi:hypothetical protein